MEAAQAGTFSSSITFVIFTYNEERRLPWVIKNFKNWGKILVVDNFSEDRTVEIAKEYGCDVLMNKNQGWVEDEITTARVKETVQTEWIYWGFADEMLSVESMKAIMRAVESEKYDIVNVARKNYYYGKFCYDVSPDRLNRIFKKNAIDFSGNVIHGFGKSAVSENRICYLDKHKYYVHHLNSYYAKSYLRTTDRYSDIQADSIASKQDSPSVAREIVVLFLRTVKIFVQNYFMRGGWRAGSAGVYLILEMLMYQWLLAMKVHEKRRRLLPQEIEALNDEARSKILYC